jgi:hypothetical protein
MLDSGPVPLGLGVPFALPASLDRGFGAERCSQMTG